MVIRTMIDSMKEENSSVVSTAIKINVEEENSSVVSTAIKINFEEELYVVC